MASSQPSDVKSASAPSPVNQQPVPSNPDELTADAAKAMYLANIEQMVAFTYSIDCTKGSHSARAQCQRMKASKLISAASARRAILAGNGPKSTKATFTTF